ncbi:MAG TPA: hypothetical protein VFO85_10890, partial [Vicinamibacteria bacterium]|nr:hypothetical protein [Vicinamibacteria bacterium]
AAVLGREFVFAVVARMTGLDEDAVLEAVEEAQAAQVVAEVRGQGAATYAFTHALVRQTLAEELSLPRRQRLHLRAAAAIEQVHARDPMAHAVALAHHNRAAGVAADPAKGLAYARRAAEDAMAAYAWEEAARWWEAALEFQEMLNPDDTATAARCDLLLALGRALIAAGQPRRAVDAAATPALSLSEAQGDAARAVQACRLAIQALGQYGASVAMGTPEYRWWAERATRHAPPANADRVHADIALGRNLREQGRFEEARALHVRAIATARALDDPEVLSSGVLALLGGFSTAPQHHAERLGLAEEFVTRLRSHASDATVVALLFWCGIIVLDHGQRERAEAMWHEVAETVARTRDAG